MNTPNFISKMSMIAVLVTTFSCPALASTILINFEKKMPATASSRAATTEKKINGQEETKNLSNTPEMAEEFLSQYLHEMGYTVVTSNELAPSQWLTAKEIQSGRSGKITILRKMAALHDAGILFNALMNDNTTRQEYLGVAMNSSVVSIAYKLIETESGDTIDIDSRKYTSTARVLEYAQHDAIEKMAKDVAQSISSKLSVIDVDKSQAGLAKYKQELMKPPKEYAAVKKAKKGTPNTVEIKTKEGVTISLPEDKNPPEIILIQPPVTRGFAVVLKKPSPTIDVAGLVRDDSPIRYLTLNGSNTVFDANGNFSKNVAIKDGANKIVIEAMDDHGNKSRKEFQIHASNDYSERGDFNSGRPFATLEMKPALWGLSIGVSNYGSTMTNLKYADKDALSLSDFFSTKDKQLYSEVNFKTLVNEDVTRDSIIENIASHLGQAAPEDVVFIFMAGHGVKHVQTGSYYFLPYDVDSTNLLSKGLRMSDFEESVNILSQNVNKLIIAMDTCHSGSLNLNVRTEMGGENLAEVLKESNGIYILASAKGGEVSLEDHQFKLHDKDSGHGVFTYALIDGMMGKANFDGDEYISLNELFQFVAKQVPRLTQGRQHPFFRSAGTDMPLVMLAQTP